MPRREFRPRDRSGRFWAISLDHGEVTTWSGKVGTAGRKRTQAFASPADAWEGYCDLVAEKVEAGWAPTRVHREFHLAAKSPMFWTITVAGRQRTVLSGKAGTAGRASIRLCNS